MYLMLVMATVGIVHGYFSTQLSGYGMLFGYLGANNRAANDPSVLRITEKVPSSAFSWLKAPSSNCRSSCSRSTSVFTFKTLCKIGAETKHSKLT